MSKTHSYTALIIHMFKFSLNALVEEGQMITFVYAQKIS